MTVSPDYYALLSVPRTADDCALKKAYKKAAVKYHPDKHANAPEAERIQAEANFKQICAAFEVLSDPNKRAIYDRYGEEGLKTGGGPTPSSGGFCPTKTNMSSEQAEMLFQNIFGAMGGGMGGRQGFSGNGSKASQGVPPGLAQMFGGMGGMGGMGGIGGMGGMGGAGGSMDDAFAKPKRRRASSAPSMLPAGTSVKLVGLSNAAFNGARGSIEDFDPARGRYLVEVHGRGTSIAVAPDSVRQVVSSATVTATSRAELNGRAAASVMYDRATKRYQVEGLTADGSILALKPESVCLPKHVHVIVDGVQSRPALNGRKGQIIDVDQERYLVEIPGEAPMRLRFGNVIAY